VSQRLITRKPDLYPNSWGNALQKGKGAGCRAIEDKTFVFSAKFLYNKNGLISRSYNSQNQLGFFPY
jgi:hypothetical protein